MGFRQRSAVAVAALALSAPAMAQTIYTCTDASGRRHTSDRPLLECIDREQRILNPSGTLRGRLSPSYTAAERAALQEAARRETEERNREIEQRQRTKALLTRYPTQDTLDRERAAALATLEDIVGTAHQRAADLLAERRKLENEASFYARDPSRMPATLRQSLDQNDQQLQAQERFIAEQKLEMQRVNERFDDMQRHLNRLWGAAGATPTVR
ncbi:DUF4124 domain-containing protein [Ramlibacter sp. AN1015]|uniref:DUF4124 domain-containing protein n=1 Tax=Ramlibacter sp. AN1015 TaxID=3133428 RepID=UPI0030C12577